MMIMSSAKLGVSLPQCDGCGTQVEKSLADSEIGRSATWTGNDHAELLRSSRQNVRVSRKALLKLYFRHGFWNARCGMVESWDTPNIRSLDLIDEARGFPVELKTCFLSKIL